jgi:hypothetical protein
MLRFSSRDAHAQYMPTLRLGGNRKSIFKFEIAYLPDGMDRAEIQVIGNGWLPSHMSLSLQPIPSLLAAVSVAARQPHTLFTHFSAETGAWRQGLHKALAASIAGSQSLPVVYQEWVRTFDTWSKWRIAPLLAALPDRPAVHVIIFATEMDSPALAATLASLRVQSYPVSGIDIVRPGAPIPAPATPFTAVLQAGEVIAWHALPVLLREMAATGLTDAVFADEDCLAADGSRHHPSFKPQPGFMMICSGLMTRGVWLVRSELLPHGASPGWAECLRLQVWFARHEIGRDDRIRRIPAVLTHRQADAEAAPPQALAAMIDAALLGRGVRASAVPVFPLRLHWEVDTRDRIDVIVPSRLRGDIQISCLLDVLTRTTHSNFSMCIVVTQDMPLDAEQLAVARRLEATGRATIRLLERSSFNYSTANNFAAGLTGGALICLLNDDVSLIDGDWLSQMAGRFSDPKTGIVGAKLYYPDGRTQHGGVILGLAGLAEHAHKFLPRGDAGYMSRAVLDQEMSAVTGACLMVRRTLFEHLGGLDESLPSGFNDVDFCLRIRALGYAVIMAASVELVHHETITFGHHYADNAEAERADAQTMHARWRGVIASDPYHNPNLSLRPNAEWELAAPPRYDPGAGNREWTSPAVPGGDGDA